MSATPNKPTILVVDDENDNLVLISLWLQELGYRVVTAVNGEDAVTVTELARPQLILMDIAMPKMDGLTATRRIRRFPESSELPIIFLTAFESREFRQQASDAGGDGYLTKPINFDRLGNLINLLLTGEMHPAAGEETAAQTEISDHTGELDPRFMLWRMFCAENNISVDMLPSQLSRELKRKWQQLKRTPRPLFKF